MTPETQERMRLLVHNVRQGPVIRGQIRLSVALVGILGGVIALLLCEIISRL